MKHPAVHIILLLIVGYLIGVWYPGPGNSVVSKIKGIAG